MSRGRVLVRDPDGERWYDLPLPPEVERDILSERAAVIRYVGPDE